MKRNDDTRFTWCVFGSSATKTPLRYKEAAHQLGEIIALSGNRCINGGGNTGVMGSLNDGLRAQNG